MVSGTGCLGLSMRTTVITAAVITLMESAAWLALSVTSYLTYTCIFTIPDDLSLNLRLMLIIYYLNPECHDVADLADLTPAGRNGTLLLDGDDVATAQRTALWSIVYIAASFLWLGSSLVFLATMIGRLPGRPAARLCYPWVIITASTLLIDVVAMSFYAVDASAFGTLDSVKSASNLVIPEHWLDGSDEGFVLKTGPLVILFVTVRGVVLWLLNGVLLVHVARAVRTMVIEDGGIRKPQRRRARKAPPSPTPSRSSSPHGGGTARASPERAPALPQTAEAPLEAAVQTAVPHDAAPGAAPTADAVPSPVLPAQTEAVADPTVSAQSTPAASRRLPPDPLVRAGSRRSMSPPARQPQPAPAKVLTGRLADRMQERYEDRHQHETPATKEEIVQRLERFGLRSSAGHAHFRDRRDVWEQSPRVPPRSRVASSPHEHHDHIPEHEAFSRPSREMSRLYMRTNSVEGRRAREPEDAPRRRPAARLDRTHSDRALAGEWRMGQRPPGNLHGLSPLHTPRGHAGHTGHALPDATVELKKDLPWSYLTGPPTDPDKSHVIHNVYLPPSGWEGEFHQRSSSNAPRREDRLHGDDFY